MNLYFSAFFSLFILSLFMFFMFLLFLKMDYILFLDWDVIHLNSSSLSLSLLLDWMSNLFMSCVFMISSMVILYSKDYMNEYKYNYRFLILILLFIMSMMFLIVSPNMISILLGWDGLGLVSYCLVVYFGNYKSYNAGMLTILINRLGDVSILMSLYYMFNFGDWLYIFYMYYWEDWMFYFLIMIIIASFTKSAQIPFSSWLPAAMAAPTPVSSLVHSSTLVTAGVYLMVRFNNLLLNFNTSLFLYISLLTMFMSGLGANFEFDLKKIIALSTLSQLGMMMVILLVGNSPMSFFHLLCHAFFKALLFLCAGMIIHSMSDSQDIRHMGNLINQMPMTCSCFCISSLSLCGTPFLSGFYSKDLILEYSSMYYMNMFIYLLLFISVGLTVSYSVRLIYYCVGNYNGLFIYQSCVETKNMLLSLFIMTFMSIFGGSLMSWLIFSSPILIMLSLLSKLSPLIFVFLGVYLGYELSFSYWFYSFKGKMLDFLYNYMSSMWFLPYFSVIFISTFMYWSKFYWNFNDFSWGEYIMSHFIPRINYTLSLKMFMVDSRNLKIYMLLFFMMILMLILI
uniref:NADH dehydrogenase subunit 5 n=1 Tax=Tessaromerus quadriarticulatus TaxID=3020145 RepID=UPI0024114F45|nr:NADH dehydrogenase subunit 5 [Tessaromerus quadriarticulatus]WEM32409.1 NADH dehydrogenase subunit 5 [Tessaromerus quadriarticulatus]